MSAESREDARPQGERGGDCTSVRFWDVHGSHGDRNRMGGFKGQAGDPVTVHHPGSRARLPSLYVSTPPL